MKLEFDSIEECFEFIKRINPSSIPKKDVTTAEMQNNEKYLQHNDLSLELNSIWKELTILRDKKDKNNFNEDKKEKTIRNYSNSVKMNLPKIIKFNKDGTFIVGRKNGRQAKWTIETLLQLRKYIKTPITLKEISQKLNLDSSTCNRLMYCIELGKFDQYFDEWEQIKANSFYDSIKANNVKFIENNPQKRKEKGMY